MTTKTITLSQLKEYIDVALLDDNELLFYYDEGENVKSLNEACDNLHKKIELLYPNSSLIGVEYNNEKVGYFVYETDLLISFALNKIYRTQEHLKKFWDIIVHVIGNTFKTVLYSYNTRAIGWLIKCGMQPILTNVTILQLCQQEG